MRFVRDSRSISQDDILIKISLDKGSFFKVCLPFWPRMIHIKAVAVDNGGQNFNGPGCMKFLQIIDKIEQII